MINTINEKREEMHKLINSKDIKYEGILKVSIELDELIIEYYKMKNKEIELKKYE